MSWQTAQLSQGIADVVRGVTFSQGDAAHESRDGFLPVLRAGNIGERLETERDLVWIPKQFVSDRQRLRKDDIVMCTSSGSALVVGKTAIAEGDFDGSWGAFNAVLRPTSAVVPKFLYYWLQSGEFKTWRDRQAKGANIQNIRHSDLSNLAIPLPAKSEQSRIVELLDEADHLRRLRREADAKAARIEPTLFERTFGKPFQDGQWPVLPLGEILSTMRNGTTADQNTDGKGYPVTRIETISAGVINPRRVRHVDMSYEEAARWLLQSGDILFSHINSEAHIGKTAIYQGSPEFLVHGMNLLLLRPNIAIVDPTYLFSLLNTPEVRAFYRGRCKRAVNQASLNQKDISSLPVPLPPLQAQKDFGAFSHQVKKVLGGESIAAEKLDELFDLMLSQAFSGQLTSRWRESHMQELVAEMSEQARALNLRMGNELEALP
jgi:type I restriction enzyme, S subunit